MAAREDELEALVGERGVLHVLVDRLRHVEQLRLDGERAITPDAVDGAVACRRLQPGPRVVRYAVARPAFGGDRERLLCGLLGEVEVAEEADQ